MATSSHGHRRVLRAPRLRVELEVGRDDGPDCGRVSKVGGEEGTPVVYEGAEGADKRAEPHPTLTFLEPRVPPVAYLLPDFAHTLRGAHLGPVLEEVLDLELDTGYVVSLGV